MKKEQLIPVNVVIISGQSNGVGCSHSDYISHSMGQEKYDEFLSGYPTIKIAYDCWTKDWPTPETSICYSQNASRDYNFVKVQLGQGNYDGSFGPEIGIAEELHNKYANKLFLIKYACGATNLRDDWLGNNPPLYKQMIDYIKLQMNNLAKQGYYPVIKAFCWMQGEGDAFDGYYQEYLNNQRRFVNDLRKDLYELAGNKPLPFIDAGISDASVWERYQQVNEAKKAFSEENELNIYIDTIKEGLHTHLEPYNEPDLYHYDSESEVLLGHLFAKAFKKFLD